MTVFIAIAIISTAAHIPTVTDILARMRTLRPARVSLPRAMSMSRARRPRPNRNDVRAIAFPLRLRAAAATLFVHVVGSCFRSRTRGLAQHDV